MNILGILFLIYFCISIEVKAEENQEEMVEMAKNMIRSLAQDCKEEEKATDVDIEDMIENRENATQKSKCVRKCMLKAFNLMDENGIILITNFLQLAEMLSDGKAELVEIVKEIAEICKNVEADDQCEKAFKFGMCVEENARAKGLYPK